MAVWKGHLDVVVVLIEKKVNINSRNAHGNTALQRAAVNGHEALIHVLLHHGADANISNDKGDTALHMATKYKQIIWGELIFLCIMEESSSYAGAYDIKLLKGGKKLFFFRIYF